MPRPDHMDLSDDDSVSITSTVASDKKSDYVVEGIIAEAEQEADDEMLYLVRWEGYPDERCTWEPEDSFQNPDTLMDWQTKKMRIARGLEKPCDTQTLLNKVEKWISSTNQRKSRRRAKRIRLGLPVPPIDESDVEIVDDEDDSLFEEQEAIEPDESPVSRRTSKSTDSTIPLAPKNDYNVSPLKENNLVAPLADMRQNKTDEKAATPLTQSRRETAIKPTNASGKAPTAIMFHAKPTQNSDRSSFISTSKSSTASPTKGVFETSIRDSSAEKGSLSPKKTLGLTKEPFAQPVKKGRRKPSVSEKVSSDRMSGPKPFSGSIQPVSGKLKIVSPTGQDATRPEPNSPSIINPISKRRRSPPELIKKPRLAVSTASARSSTDNTRNKISRAQGTQMGRRGRGPARLNTSVRPSAYTSKKRNVSGSAVLKNWSKTISPRKYTVFQPTMRKSSGKLGDKFGKLSTMRRFEKRGRNEPAPNIENLTFLDLKHGNAKKPPPPLPNLITNSLTPYQLIQQALESPSRDQINQSPISDKPKPATEASDQDIIALADQIDEPTEYGGPETENPELLSAPSHEETTEPPRSPRRSSISFQRYKEHASLPLHSPPSMPKAINPQKSPIEKSTSNNSELRTETPRASTNIDSHDIASSLKQPATPGALNTSQTDLVNTWEPSDVMATLMIGEECRTLGAVRFRGLGKFARLLFLSMKVPPRQMHIWCQKICTVAEYQTSYHLGPSEYFGLGYSGFVVPFIQTTAAIAAMAETLKSHASCAVFSFTSFCLLIYPVDAGLESWGFLSHMFPHVPDGAALRFILRKPLPQLDGTEIEILTRRDRISFREDESNASLLVRNLLGIEYERLIKQPNPSSGSNNFFLFFINAEQEYRMMFKFLDGHGAKIFSWDTEGAWDYFTSKIETGVILIEGSFWEIYLIPNLARVLRKSINVFNITFYKDVYAPHPHINRLFPHGNAFLITDSFILLCPHEAARFLRWFRLSTLTNKPAGTWQLCTRPHIRDYILCLVDARTVDEGHVFMEIYESLWYMLPEDLMDDDEFETPIDEAPVRCMSEGVNKFDHDVGKYSKTNEPMDEEAIARNDATHVEWFTGWSLTELERFRRFTVVSGARGDRKEAERKEWESQWSHIDVVGPETLFEKMRIPEWESKDKAVKDKAREDQAKRKGKAHENPSRKRAGERKGSL